VTPRQTPTAKEPADLRKLAAEQLRKLAHEIGETQHQAANILSVAGYSNPETITQWMIEGAETTYHLGQAKNAAQECARLLDPPPLTGEVLQADKK